MIDLKNCYISGLCENYYDIMLNSKDDTYSSDYIVGVNEEGIGFIHILLQKILEQKENYIPLNLNS